MYIIPASNFKEPLPDVPISLPFCSIAPTPQKQ